eukprot:4035224-Pleurochrysis_carterae.AAC.4
MVLGVVSSVFLGIVLGVVLGVVMGVVLGVDFSVVLSTALGAEHRAVFGAVECAFLGTGPASALARELPDIIPGALSGAPLSNAAEGPSRANSNRRFGCQVALLAERWAELRVGYYAGRCLERLLGSCPAHSPGHYLGCSRKSDRGCGLGRLRRRRLGCHAVRRCDRDLVVVVGRSTPRSAVWGTALGAVGAAFRAALGAAICAVLGASWSAVLFVAWSTFLSAVQSAALGAVRNAVEGVGWRSVQEAP